jgi:TolB protein
LRTKPDRTSPIQQDDPPRRRASGRKLVLGLALLVVVSLGLLSLSDGQRPVPEPTFDPTLVAFATILAQSTPSATITLPPPTARPTDAPTRTASSGTLFFAARSSGHSHLWAYVPGDARPIQLTRGDWDDRDPAVDPQGQRIVFTSHRDGNWDLYLLMLKTGDIRRVTQTAGFEGHPVWSPDGQWVAFEGDYDGDFDIWILPIDGDQSPVQLTNDPAADMTPAWDSGGRRIAFISDREGSPDVYIADLDHVDDRFTNLTHSPQIAEGWPAFSPDGTRLAYTARGSGVDMLLVQDLERMSQPPQPAGQGREASWSPDGRTLAAVLETPLGSFLMSYTSGDTNYAPIGLSAPVTLLSLDWSSAGLAGEVQSYTNILPEENQVSSPVAANAGSSAERLSLIELPGVQAPYPRLSDSVDEAFNALRQRVASELGWDFLEQLQYAFVGLNDPLPPGFAFNDWLYTGRAFAFSEAAVQAGWVEVVREDFGAESYWRVFVRVKDQGGDYGEPMRERPWVFSSRNEGDPAAYDRGGTLADDIPQGFYVDFTTLAADYGFERLPALTNWRTFYPGARFSEFAMTSGLDWETAMLELYPASAIVTPTVFRTPTLTPTMTPRPTWTPWWWRWTTPTATRTLTPVPPTVTPRSP